MAGSTATISIEQFRADWLENKPIALLCDAYTITKDQVIRLRDVWHLPLRHDRRFRHKPGRVADPTPKQIEEACVRIQATWDENTREARRVIKSSECTMRCISLSSIDLDVMSEADE